jgi:ubiquinone/menaquinone biosynthesis C-methylase UbiE
MEVEAISAEIQKSKPNRFILDVGCGDGLTTIEIAARNPDCYIIGIDFSEKMIQLAGDNLCKRPDLSRRICFDVADITTLVDKCSGAKFVLVLSNRCLINLDVTEQYKALESISGLLKPGGKFIATENFVEGHDAMNNERVAIGLPEIPIQGHNNYFTESKFIEHGRKNFMDIKISDFSSSYYYATRVIYSKMCQMNGVEPDYDHDIHRLATKLIPRGKFSPIKLIVMKSWTGREFR